MQNSHGHNGLKAIRFIQGSKVSHDYLGKDITLNSYDVLRDGILNGHDYGVGIPAKQNRLVIVDVDVAGATHQHDGTEFWHNFSKENGIPATYTVGTPSGGRHYYFKLPESLDENLVSFPGHLAPGVDIKWNGWVGSPPTPGYQVLWGTFGDIQYIPPSLMAALEGIKRGKSPSAFMNPEYGVIQLHKPFTKSQLNSLKDSIKWVQLNCALSRDEWRDGLFSLKSGIPDPEILEEYAVAWTQNQGYVTGDEEQAMAIVEKASPFGDVGPGTILEIIKRLSLQKGVEVSNVSWTVQDVLDRARVQIKTTSSGVKVEPTESNVGSILGAVYDEKTLYHDVRSDIFVFENKGYNEKSLANKLTPLIQSPAYGLGLENFRQTTIKGGLEVLMMARQRDPHKEMLESVQWDGIQRVQDFFTRYCKCPDSAYHRKAAKDFWCSLAARGLKPGCKVDFMLVLEGSEGKRKSSLVEAIAGRQYLVTPNKKKEVFENLDELRKMHQSVIVELPELIGLAGQDPIIVKAIISKPFDTYRDLFTGRATQRERGFVLVGTTNQTKWLDKEMGDRRFIPIALPDDGSSIDIDGVLRDRDQLYAEAVAIYRTGYEYWKEDKELLRTEIEKRVYVDPVESMLKELNFLTPEGMTTIQIFKLLEQSGVLTKGLGKATFDRIEQSLKSMGAQKVGDKWMLPMAPYQPPMPQAMTQMAQQVRPFNSSFISNLI